MQFPINITARPARTVRSVPRTSARRRRMGSTALWTIQGALAAIFLFAGVSKLVMPTETLTQGTGLPALFLRFIGVCETLGAAGLVLPGVLRMHRELTPIAGGRPRGHHGRRNEHHRCDHRRWRGGLPVRRRHPFAHHRREATDRFFADDPSRMSFVSKERRGALNEAPRCVC